MTLLRSLVLLVGCAEDTGAEEVCEPPPRAAMVVSEAEVDFGEVAVGDSATRTITLTNDGDYALGVTSVSVGDEGTAFVVSYDLASTPCAWVPGDELDPPERVDTGWEVPRDPDDDEPVIEAPRGHAFVLEPGCALRLNVSFVPTASGETWDALAVDSDLLQDAAESGFRADLVHGQRLVWLRGTTPPGEDLREAPYIVGNRLAFEQTGLLEGETIEMEVRVHSPTGRPITYDWSADSGTFADAHLPRVAYIAPAVDACDERHISGSLLNVYAVMFGEGGHQDWAFGRVLVWDSTEPLYGVCPEAEETCPDEEERGCRGGAALLFVLGAFASRRQLLRR
jgi:hypothetical protein